MSDPVVPPQHRDHENGEAHEWAWDEVFRTHRCWRCLVASDAAHEPTCPKSKAAAPVVPAERPHQVDVGEYDYMEALQRLTPEQMDAAESFAAKVYTTMGSCSDQPSAEDVLCIALADWRASAADRVSALTALAEKWEQGRQKIMLESERLENIGEERRARIHDGRVQGLEICIADISALLDPAERPAPDPNT